MDEVTSSRKGAIAETAITAAAVRLGIDVYRPVVEGARADLVFDTGRRVLKVQCKWGNLKGDLVQAHIGTCRYTPARGYVRTTYAAADVDGIAVYCAAIERCYWLPIEEFAGRTVVHLRLRPARNNQRAFVTMAADYPLGAVAQLEERRHGMAEVRGSSPLSSMETEAAR
jgi:hypothetical protein